MRRLKQSPPCPAPRAVTHVGVVGGGLMGSGVAAVTLPWAQVTVKDVSPEALERCSEAIRSSLDRISPGKRHPVDARDAPQRGDILARLSLTTRTDDLADCDLIIEAVPENLNLKQRVVAELEEHVASDAIIASNTSALPIAQIAGHAQHPERVIGMHFFSPVPRMPLLELIVARQTAPWVVAAASDVAMKQGKTVIVVRDRPGFYTSRVLAPFLNEAVALIRDGATVESVDAAACHFGFPVGPLKLLDALGIDVAAHVLRDLSRMFPQPEPFGGQTLEALHRAGFAGRKNGRGFYRYDSPDPTGPRPVNAEIYWLLGQRDRQAVAPDEIEARLSLSMVNEAARCLHEEVILCPRDGDIGAVMGLGFPASLGGPFRYVDSLGASAVVAALERLHDRLGVRFEPASLLRDMAREGGRFYPE